MIFHKSHPAYMCPVNANKKCVEEKRVSSCVVHKKQLPTNLNYFC